MARFITIVIALFNCMLFEATGEPCSTKGISGLTGCECNYVGACDVDGQTITHLNLSNHVPQGLDVFASVRDVRSGRNLAYLCEGNVVAILYDCNNRIPLYSATVITKTQLEANPGSRPTGSPGRFRASTGLDKKYQQTNGDYLKASTRENRFETPVKTRDGTRKRTMPMMDRGRAAKVPLHSSPADSRVAMHRGHIIASNFGVGDYTRKVETFVYTNAVPQVGSFNSGSWNAFEQRLVQWGRTYCLNEGGVRHTNVRMFIVVGAIPSTFPPEDLAKVFFGREGFNSYQDNKNFRVNLPKELWTASCCTFQYTGKDGRPYSMTRSTAYWGENKVDSKCTGMDVKTLEKKLTLMQGKKEINLFPFSDECNRLENYKTLP